MGRRARACRGHRQPPRRYCLGAVRGHLDPHDRRGFDALRPLWTASFEMLAQLDHAPEVRKAVADAQQRARLSLAALFHHLDPTLDERLAWVVGSFHLALLPGVMAQWLIDPESTLRRPATWPTQTSDHRRHGRAGRPGRDTRLGGWSGAARYAATCEEPGPNPMRETLRYRGRSSRSMWMPKLGADAGSSSSSSLACSSSGVMSASASTSKGWLADTNPTASCTP